MPVHKLKRYEDAILDRQINDICAALSKPECPELSIHDTNASAVAAGLPVGAVYRTTLGALMVVV